jgi:hypothetical protein
MLSSVNSGWEVVMSMPLVRVALLSCALFPFSPGSAVSQETPPDLIHVDCQNRFAVIFPSPHMTRDIMYTTHTGASVPAKQFYVERGPDRFVVTSVRFPNGPAVDEAAVDHAANALRQRGEVRFNAAANYDPGMPGRQLNIFQPNGRQLRASVYMAEGHLTITEAEAAPGDFNALQFEQSITLINAEGVDRDANANQPPRRFECGR